MKILKQLRAVLFRRRLEREMAEEMHAHVDAQAELNVRAGLSPQDARDAARREFGHADSIKEAVRDQRGIVWLDQLGQDLRFALRQLRRNPGFAATAISILALGIGSTTTIFSAVNGIVLKSLPYQEAGRLVQLFEAPEPGETNNVSPGVVKDWQEQTTSYEGIGFYRPASVNLTGGGEPERLSGLRMSANGLQLLRARPVHGRIFAADEDQPGRERVIVLTHQLWQRRFGGDPGIIGQTIRIDDQPHSVIGVLPPGFLPFEAQEFVLPLVYDPQWRQQRGTHPLRVLARLKPGVSLEQAQAELTAVTQSNKALYPDWKRAWGATVKDFQAQLVARIRSPLFVLLGAVAMVLLIACTNVANLLLAKASGRRKEIAVRSALGAGRRRIVRQLLTESLVLSLAGGSLGTLAAYGSIGALRRTLTAMGWARAHEVALDGMALVIALAGAVLTGLFFGLAPAVQASRPEFNDALKDGARATSSSGNRLRGSLIVGEIALALVLLAGAGLLLHSFSRIMGVSSGFDARGVITAQLQLPDQRYPDNARRLAFYGEVVERMKAVPGVTAAAFTEVLPLRGGLSNVFLQIPGRINPREPGYLTDYSFCTADYFRAMGIPLLRGRVFTAAEVGAGATLAVISAETARDFFPGEDPLGRKLRQGEVEWEIIGIVGDVRGRALSEAVPPMVYRPRVSAAATLVVRTEIPGLATSLREVIRQVDPMQPVGAWLMLEEIVARSVAERELTLRLLGAFAGIALLLAAIGLYGVMSYSVTQRTREFGIRLALGADSRDVLRLVFGHSLKLVAAGLGLGLIGAFWLSRFLQGLLFEVRPTDPVTFAVVPLLLLAAALLASWLPARRAARVDPMIALRAE